MQAKLTTLGEQVDKDVDCPLCERSIPPSQRDAHHLVPKSHGGKHTVVLHRNAKLNSDDFDLAIELLRDWRIDRFYIGKAKAFDTATHAKNIS